MIKFDEVFCLDLKDDFEESGRRERNFDLYEFLQDDLSRAFAFGFCHLDWNEEKMWFPTTVRKQLRHISDGLDEYTPQLKWLNDKYGIYEKEILILDYVNYIIDNIFCDNPRELLRIIFMIGTNLGISGKKKQSNEIVDGVHRRSIQPNEGSRRDRDRFC